MEKDKRWVRLLLFLPLPVFMVLTNYYQDPGNIYHDESRNAAALLADGKEVFYSTGNSNERELKRLMILNMATETDCVAVGPSLVLCVNRDLVGTDSFLNLGESGSDFYDIIGKFGVMEAHGKKIKRVIFCVDSYFFNEDFYGDGPKNNAQKPYVEYMLDILDGKEPQPVAETEEENNDLDYEQLFSVSYFQSSWAQITANDSYIVKNRMGVVDENYDGKAAYYGTDGSYTYESDYQANDAEYVRKQCEQYKMKFQLSYDKHINPYSVDVFRKLIAHLTEQGISVELFLCPFPPTLWDRMQKEKEHYFIFDEITELAQSTAKQYGLKLTGAYDPYKLGITDGDFYDERHVRRERLGEFFDFSESE